nr:hypothetical protein [Tanacetum cinerariifolium]
MGLDANAMVEALSYKIECFKEDGDIGGDGCIGDGDGVKGVLEKEADRSKWILKNHQQYNELLVLERIVEEEEDGGILVVVEDVGVSLFATVMLTTLVLDWFVVVVSTDDSHFKSSPSRLCLIGVLRPIVPEEV